MTRDQMIEIALDSDYTLRENIIIAKEIIRYAEFVSKLPLDEAIKEINETSKIIF